MLEKLWGRGDWQCLLTAWAKPGDYLRHMRWEVPEHLPAELRALIDVPQDPTWHPEGDAFEHTCCVVDAMADILDDGASCDFRTSERAGILMCAALTHDLGKSVTTRMDPDKGRWTSKGHAQAGVPLAETMLSGLDVQRRIIDPVLPLVAEHMAHTQKGFTQRATRRLGERLRPATMHDLLLLMLADCRGRGPASSDLPAPVQSQLVPIAHDLRLL
jgi:tRNA nucleotidyltransferase (CCA-adding enzyme)